MKTNTIDIKKRKRYNHLLGAYILGITVFMTVFSLIQISAYL